MQSRRLHCFPACFGSHKTDQRADRTRYDPAQTQRIERQPGTDPVHNALRKSCDLEQIKDRRDQGASDRTDKDRTRVVEIPAEDIE